MKGEASRLCMMSCNSLHVYRQHRIVCKVHGKPGKTKCCYLSCVMLVVLSAETCMRTVGMTAHKKQHIHGDVF